MLENKLGIQDAVELAKVEEQLSKKRAKELFENIGEDLDDFYRLSQAVKNGQLSERNSKRLEELLGKFHVIKAAMRIIENKRGDYHL